MLGVDDLLRARQVRLVDARGLNLHVIKNIFHVRINQLEKLEAAKAA